MLKTGGTPFLWLLSDVHLLVEVRVHYHACAVLPLGKAIPTTRPSLRPCVTLRNLILFWGQSLLIFRQTLNFKSNLLSAVHECIRQECINFSGKEPQSLFWTGSWTTWFKITISSVPNLTNYCVIFTVYNLRMWPKPYKTTWPASCGRRPAS
jgi:hypothetical protein